MICPGLNDTVYQNDTPKKWKIFTKNNKNSLDFCY